MLDIGENFSVPAILLQRIKTPHQNNANGEALPHRSGKPQHRPICNCTRVRGGTAELGIPSLLSQSYWDLNNGCTIISVHFYFLTSLNLTVEKNGKGAC